MKVPVLVALLSALLLLSGCSLPRIAVLHDPLTPEEHDTLGAIYESEGEYDLAAEQYREAVRQDKNHVPSLLLLGDALYRLRNYREAETAYQKALRIEPKNSGARNNLAWVYIRTETNLETARKLVLEAISLSPDLRPYFLDTLGVVLVKQGNWPDGIRALQESVDTIPKERRELIAEAQEHLAQAYKTAGDEEKYIEAVEMQRKFRDPAGKGPTEPPR